MRVLELGTALTFALLALPSVVAAEGSCGDSALAIVEHIFTSADSDQDGILIPAEYEEAELERFGVTFEETDADADGLLTLAEYIELYARHHHPDNESSS